MEISFTRLRVYLECPWKYKLFFVDGQKIPLTPAAALGIAIHRALERYHRSGEGGEDVLLDAFDGEWLSGPFVDPEIGKQWRSKGERILKRYARQDQARRSEVLGAEREFCFPLGRHEIRGMIDRIDRRPDGGVEIVDYKTQMEPGDESVVGEDLQLRFYALGAKESLALSPSTLTMHYLAADKIVSVPYDAAREGELKALIEKTADRIEAMDFKADTSFCSRCDFRKTCRFSAVRA